ncbi:hypothetical protein ACFW2V_12925 [Streptomyces sp. NPDC058947]|uniref:hypothetical protein n=1 Tax=Streptomyces sp. NPDC058947 TaxID=3346675 RepID=UPI0036C8382C
MTDLSTVSSEAVIAAYRQQLSDAHHLLAISEARLAKALKMLQEQPSSAPPATDLDLPVEPGGLT